MTDIHSDKILQLHLMLSSAEHPVIVTHMRPDGDAIGSSMGMYHTFKKYNKRAIVALVNPAPSNLDFLIPDEITEDILVHETDAEATELAISSSDLIICLDFNAFHRTDTLAKALEEASAKKVLIDHHLAPDVEKFSLVFSKQDISSASELLYHILMALPPIGNDAGNLPAEAGTALMTGMTTDTNNFANSTYPSTLNMASDLLSAGVDRDRIINELYNKQRENRVRLMGHVLKDLLTITEDGVAYIVLDSDTQKKYDIREGETEGFVNIPLSISNVRMSFLLKEDGEKVRVSIRSRKGTSANRCARLYFNGGGHENAAGGKLFIPKDINDISEAGDYIARHTHTFLTEQ
jgi:phosphoesterase RecJ-like protein